MNNHLSRLAPHFHGLFFVPVLMFVIWACPVATGQVEEPQQTASESKRRSIQQWSQWRGPLGTGVSPDGQPPTTWSETENIRWKTSLEGLGHSTPAVWKDKIFLTTAIPFGPEFPPIRDNAPGSHDNLPVRQRFRFAVICVSLQSGKVVWTTKCKETIPHEGAHVSASLASASPVVDQDHVIAHFGSHGTYCLNHDGDLVWKKTLGKMATKHAHGEGASPALHEKLLAINWDHEGDSFVVVLDKATGQERWRKSREEVTSWSSPIFAMVDNKLQVIVAGTGAVRGYDAKSGDVIWECSGLSNNIVATPIASKNRVFVGSSYEIKSMMALSLSNARGNLKGTKHMLWRRATRTPYVPSPLLYHERLYFLRHYQGILSIADASTGEETLGPFRLPYIRDVYASPVAADGKIYISDRDGVTLVISEKEMPKLLSVNRLDDSINASLVILGDKLLVRGEKHLYLIQEAPSAR